MSTALHPPIPGKNKYVVWDPTQDRFVEFLMKLGEVQIGNFLEIIVAPPIRRAGFLSYKKQIFYISLHDLLRNHFNVTRPYITPVRETSTGSSTNVGTQSLNNTDQCISKTSSGNELDEESSIHWKEQIRSLLNSEDPEEGWEFPETTQP